MNFLANQYIPGIQEYREKLEHKNANMNDVCKNAQLRIKNVIDF